MYGCSSIDQASPFAVQIGITLSRYSPDELTVDHVRSAVIGAVGPIFRSYGSDETGMMVELLR